MKVQRYISAIIGFPLVAILLIYGNKYVIDTTFALIAAISLHEYFGAFKEKYKPIKWIGFLPIFIIPFIHIIPLNILIILTIMLIPTIISIAFMQSVFSNIKYNVIDIGITLFGILYVVLNIIFLPLIHATEFGKILIWYIFFSAWGSDTFAYLIGVKFGKHKLTPVSPKKSIEGAIGGICGAVLINIIFTLIVCANTNFSISYILVIIMSVVLSALSQIGDLSASTIKRFTGIKDYGKLIPGHGGMLDRIDSIIFIAPFAYLLLVLI